MTHEFKTIINAAYKAYQNGLQTVLASVVDLDGSSYRRPGVRMLILENDDMVGAVSGGCVEKEVLLQAQTVFATGQSKMMTYDGRYRLGCEGVLYILLERVTIEARFITAFNACMAARTPFKIQSYYQKREGIYQGLGTMVLIKSDSFSLSAHQSPLKSFLVHTQTMAPCFKLVIIGAEHDAVQLCKYAALTGWEVTIVSGASGGKTIANFPGASILKAITPEQLDTISIDSDTAVVLMTHNFATDLRYLVRLQDTDVNYIGVLGPTRRREDLLNQLLEYCPDLKTTFLDAVHGPAGLDIGSETPQEIALSIMAEILAVTRYRSPQSLSCRSGRIHEH